MQAPHSAEPGSTAHRLEWMGLMIAVLSLAGLTAGGIHSGTHQVRDITLVSASR